MSVVTYYASLGLNVRDVNSPFGRATAQVNELEKRRASILQSSAVALKEHHRLVRKQLVDGAPTSISSSSSSSSTSTTSTLATSSSSSSAASLSAALAAMKAQQDEISKIQQGVQLPWLASGVAPTAMEKTALLDFILAHASEDVKTKKKKKKKKKEILTHSLHTVQKTTQLGRRPCIGLHIAQERRFDQTLQYSRRRRRRHIIICTINNNKYHVIIFIIFFFFFF
jgi:hypothetical protein